MPRREERQIVVVLVDQVLRHTAPIKAGKVAAKCFTLLTVVVRNSVLPWRNTIRKSMVQQSLNLSERNHRMSAERHALEPRASLCASVSKRLFGSTLHILRSESGMLGNSRKHSRTDLILVVKCPDIVGPSLPRQHAMRAAGSGFSTQPILNRAARTRRACVLAHWLMRRRRTRSQTAARHRSQGDQRGHAAQELVPLLVPVSPSLRIRARRAARRLLRSTDHRLPDPLRP